MDANTNRSQTIVDPNLQRSSHLFLVRVWTGEGGDDQGQGEWYGKVQHVLSGETHTFKDWNSLQPLVEAMLPAKVDYSHQPNVPMPRD